MKVSCTFIFINDVKEEEYFTFIFIYCEVATSTKKLKLVKVGPTMHIKPYFQHPSHL